MVQRFEQSRVLRFVKRLGHGLGVCAALVALSYGGWQVWMHVRQQPPNEEYGLFRGVVYRREARRFPRPLVIHVVTVDLDAPGLGFVVTPGTPNAARPLRARTTSAFLSESGAQVAVNADFFYPWYSHSPLSYYPHVGDPITPEAFAASQGVVYHTTPARGPRFPTLFLSRDNRARFAYAIPAVPAACNPVYNAVSGNRMLLAGGVVQRGTRVEEAELNPRTAVGLDRAGRKMILVLVDGRQPNYSEGATLVELTAILQQYGAWDAMNFDGGGSSTLVTADPQRGPRVLNCPIDSRIPDRERPVANHLGIYARPL